MSTVDDYGNECGECAAELDSLRAQLLAAENAAANAVQSRKDWQSIADFARTERDSFRAEVEALRAKLAAAEQRAAQAEQALGELAAEALGINPERYLELAARINALRGEVQP